jgi:glycosyltransferase involved in cell wall biosynthesis
MNSAMNSDSLVSIVVIFLNAEAFIQETIESVIAQTYPHWELLLVDDGSDDCSSAIAQKYAQTYAGQIYYLEHDHHQNKGKSTSRNLGIRQAKGKYVAFLDADDVFLPGKLAQQVADLEAHPEAAMVYSNTLYWHSWLENPDSANLDSANPDNGNPDSANPDNNQADYLPDLGIATNALIQPPALLNLCFTNQAAVPCICSFLVKHSILNELGGFEEVIQHLYEDQVLLAKIFLKFPVFVADGYWEKYRQHKGSSWHLSMDTGEDQSARLIFLKWLEQYLSEQNAQESELWHNLQKPVWQNKYPALSRLKQAAAGIAKRIKIAAKDIS